MATVTSVAKASAGRGVPFTATRAARGQNMPSRLTANRTRVALISTVLNSVSKMTKATSETTISLARPMISRAASAAANLEAARPAIPRA